MMPMPVVPTMMPAVVAPMVVVPVAMMPVMTMPVHLHGLDLVDFVLRHHGRLNLYQRWKGCSLPGGRRHGSSLCGRRKQESARDQSCAEIEEIPKFHDVMP